MYILALDHHQSNPSNEWIVSSQRINFIPHSYRAFEKLLFCFFLIRHWRQCGHILVKTNDHGKWLIKQEWSITCQKKPRGEIKNDVKKGGGGIIRKECRPPLRPTSNRLFWREKKKKKKSLHVMTPSFCSSYSSASWPHNRTGALDASAQAASVFIFSSPLRLSVVPCALVFALAFPSIQTYMPYIYIHCM